MSNLVPINDIEKMATAVAKSGLFGVKNPEQAMALMLIAQAEGMHPAIAARDYYVIQGKPALKADAMMARFQSSGGKVEWKVYTDKEVTGVFSHPSGGSVSITWTFEMATKIGLTGKDNWRNYARAMLRARCISEGIRTVYPGCVVGTYTPEEVQDFEPKKNYSAPVKDMGSAEVITPEEIEALSEPSDFQIFLPDGSVYANCNDSEEWIASYATMIRAIRESAKLDKASKKEKEKQFKAANEATKKTLPPELRVKLLASIESTDFDELEDAIEK
jgi:hypothetical protein